jgi:hypothetical protein
MKIAILFIFLVFGLTINAQGKVVWDVKYDPNSSSIQLNAVVSEGWHLYSQYVANEVGPVPTSFSFDPNPSIKIIGKVIEPTPIQKYEEVFEANLSYFINQVQFTQKIEAKKGATLTGKITFMICNDSQCLPPTDYFFSVNL